MAADSIRTCAGCGTKDEPEAFERFVWDPKLGLLHDVRHKAPGRGAHVHAVRDCLVAAARSGFRRSFRDEAAATDPETLVESVRHAIRTRLDETARLAIRSRAAAVGQRAVEEAMKNGEAAVLVLARDAGGSTRKKYAANADRKNVPVVDRFEQATIGAWSGRDVVTTMTLSGRLAENFLRDVRHLEGLGFFEA